MLTKSIVILILVALVQADYTMSFSCGNFGCPSGCKLCDVIDGGPFHRKTLCADKDGCIFDQPFNITVQCNGCPSKKTCGYYQVDSDGPWYGCTSSSDILWTQYKQILDILYSPNYYDWCGNACGSDDGGNGDNGLSAGIIVVIVLLSVGLVGGAVGFFLYKRKKAREEQKKISSLLKGSVADFGKSIVKP